MPKEPNGAADGIEIYARKIKNDGEFSSESSAKIVTNDYSGTGKITTKIPEARQKHLRYKAWSREIFIGVLVIVIAAFILNWTGLSQ